MEEEDVQKCNLNKGDAVEHYTENQEAPSGIPVEEDILKSDERNPSEMEKRLKGVEEILAKLVESDAKVHAAKATSEDTDGKREPMPVEKGEEEDKEDKEEDKMEKSEIEEKKEEVTKATLVEEPIVVQDIITKAQMDTFTKAINDELLVLKARIEKMENETIQKGGTVVVISEQVESLSASERNANIFGV